MGPLLQIEDLKTHFFTSSGVYKAVDGVSLSIPKGGRLGIVGESGSGKSVTAFSILRLVSAPGRVVGGKVWFSCRGDAGHRPGANTRFAPTGERIDLLSLPEDALREIRGGRIAMIFQEPMTSLNPVFTVGDQIGEAVELHQGVAKSDRLGKVIESLKLVRIPDAERVARAYPHELSGGMRQRVMIAMALSCRPDLLIADEPTTALDVTIQAQVLELLKDLQAELGMAFILITHDLGIIAETVDEVAVMYAGRVVEQAKTTDLFERPRHPYTRALLQALPGLEEKGERLRTIPGAVPDLSRLPTGCAYQDRCERLQPKCCQQEIDLEDAGKERKVRCLFPY